MFVPVAETAPTPTPSLPLSNLRVCPGHWEKAAPCSEPKNWELQRKKLLGALATLPHGPEPPLQGLHAPHPHPCGEERTPWGGKQGSWALGRLAGEEFKAGSFTSDLEPDLENHS